MALNPFFLQGSQSEQRLVQELINEQLKMYGLDVTYIPRKFVKRDTIFNEIQSSRFDDNYTIEAYVNTFEGHTGAGDILSKFGMSIKDELTITISKERFEDFISPFLAAESDYEIPLATRPREGDLVYFPLGQRLFEVKFVEHEDPFYQLGKNYVYQLKCELFEYEDEVLDTSIEEIDTQLEDEGYISTLKLIGLGQTAQISASINSGYVRSLFLNNDGNGYISEPLIKFDESPLSGGTATAVAITTSIGGVRSIKEILLTNAGFGYTSTPSIFVTGGGGTGAAATCSIETTYNGVVSLSIDSAGIGYPIAPIITVAPPVGVGAAATATVNGIGSVTNATITNPGQYYKSTQSPIVTINGGGGTGATATATVNSDGLVSSISITSAGTGYTTGVPTVSIGNSVADKDYVTSGLSTATIISGVSTGNVVSVYRITNPGFGYSSIPNVTVSAPPLITGTGTYQFNEEVVGSESAARSRVKDWDSTSNTLKISILSGNYVFGETLIGVASSATFALGNYDPDDTYNKYTQNDEIEQEADLLLDFTESNPFGNY